MRQRRRQRGRERERERARKERRREKQPFKTPSPPYFLRLPTPKRVLKTIETYRDMQFSTNGLQKASQNTPRLPKSPKVCQRLLQSAPKVAQSVPKGSRSFPKGSQNTPKSDLGGPWRNLGEKGRLHVAKTHACAVFRAAHITKTHACAVFTPF